MLYSIKTLQHRLAIQVTLGLFIFSFIAGIFTYQYSYKRQLELSVTFQNQLVRTIQSQAEVAAFASNEEIGRDILNGLLTNPLFMGVRLESTEIFKLEKISDSYKSVGKEQIIDFNRGMTYPLLSPVDGEERIGTLTVVRNDEHIRSEAARVSKDITFLMLSQLLMAAILIVWVSRKVITKPVAELAKEVVSVRPGENSRITVQKIHLYDEIGMLSGSINSLIDAAENALSESVLARKAAESANRAKSEFLDNSGEGFLSFGPDMLIDPEYSHECESIFEQILISPTRSPLPNGDGDNNYSLPLGMVGEGQNNYLESYGSDSSNKNIRNNDIKGLNVSDLLFEDEDYSKKQGFEKTIELIFNETLDLKRELYLSLLQTTYNIGDKHVKAKYQLIANETKMMLVLTDITREKILEQHVENERKRLKFVITAVRETRDFFAILDELNQFKQTTLPHLFARIKQSVGAISEHQDFINNINGHQSFINEILYESYRHVHTFKGLFAQQEFLSFPEFLHEIETKISKLIGKLSGIMVGNGNGNNNINEVDGNIKDANIVGPVNVVGSIDPHFYVAQLCEEIEKFVQSFQSENVLEQDLVIIRAFLGDEFIERRGDIIISSELASKIESMATALIEKMGQNIDNETLKILEQVKHLRDVDIKSLLTPHVEGALRLAERLGKYINPFKVEGDFVGVHPDKFAPFIRSLVNVFRNAIDHGIEESYERIEAEKDEYATIECEVKKLELFDNNRDCVEITISDDGRGINLIAVKDKVVAKGLIALEQVERMGKDELIDLIFLDDFSTKDSVSAMSGRGMGLSAVKTELEKLDGKVEIDTEEGRGSCFKFYIPL
ncbi:MAG: hypothetical protein HQK63_12840 [Desulfamplus sp.]|nr:hypothetical protein [Desulfamplus sp.]